jgi:UPF0755 protein
VNRTFPTPLAAIGAGIAVLAILLASYCVAKTPEGVLGERIGGAPMDGEDREEVAFKLAPGATAGDVGSQLQELGVIRSARQFELLAGLMGVQGQLNAGDFLLTKNSSVLTVLNQLTERGPVVELISVTFPEGLRYEEMAELAADAGFGTEQQFFDAVARAKLPPALAATLPEGADLQGYLFPATYPMPVGSTMDDLVAYMLDTLNIIFTAELREAGERRGLNPHQMLTLASIIEREAVIPAERPLMAGVFYNRLAEGDRLGADPTVQFAAAQDPASVLAYGWWKRELTILDLENPSPYNTRLFPGIPPGPIANPGVDSIRAVAYPEETEFYYFVADAVAGDGSHRFAVTFAEHEQNIALYGSP